MHEVGVDVDGIEIRATAHSAESGTQRLRTGEITSVQFKAIDLQVSFLETLVAKATHFDRHRFCKLPRQITNVNTRAAIDTRRILVSQEQDFHVRFTSLERHLCQAQIQRNGRLQPTLVNLLYTYFARSSSTGISTA